MTSQAQQILKTLRATRGPVRTFDLARQFGTVREALDELQSLGKIIRIRGVGAAVCAK